MGARQARTPKPHSTINGNHDIPVPAYNDTKAAAVALNTGIPQDQIIGYENVFTGFG